MSFHRMSVDTDLIRHRSSNFLCYPYSHACFFYSWSADDGFQCEMMRSCLSMCVGCSWFLLAGICTNAMLKLNSGYCCHCRMLLHSDNKFLYYPVDFLISDIVCIFVCV